LNKKASIKNNIQTKNRLKTEVINTSLWYGDHKAISKCKLADIAYPPNIPAVILANRFHLDVVKYF